MEIDKVFHNTIMYQDLEILQDYLDTFKLDPQLTSVLKNINMLRHFGNLTKNLFGFLKKFYTMKLNE